MVRGWVTIVAVLLLVVTACGGGGNGGSDATEPGGAATDAGGDGDAAGDPIELGFISIFAGRVAMLGETGFKGARLAVDQINADGGVLGRQLKIDRKDSGGDPEQAVRVAREFALEEEVDFIIDGSSSNESFAVSQASGELGTVVIATASEADSLTAPENFQELEFRSARSTLHDAIAASLYAQDALADAKTWGSVSPDYAYGRDCTDRFFEQMTENTDITVGTQLWPALFEPDYTPLIQQLIQQQPDAVYSCLWGGDLVAFVQQAQQFDFFNETTFVTPNLADSLVLKSVGGNLPAGIHTSSRFALGAPETPANEEFFNNYTDQFGEGPTNWSVQAYIGVNLLAEAIEAAGSIDPKAVAAELEGLQLAETPWGDVTMRAEDHTLIRYAIFWGVSDPEREDYPIEFTFETDWDRLLEIEEAATGGS